MIMVALLLCVCVFIPVVSLNAADENVSSSNNICKTVEYTDLEEVKDYLAGKNTYPTKEGYLFAGWYTADITPDIASDNIAKGDYETIAKNYAIQNEIPEDVDSVYALFVPANVFDVKAQLSGGLLSGLDGNSKGSIRFVTTVNSLLYKEVGFEISYINSKGAKKSATSSSNKVYEKLYAVGSTEEYKENDTEYLPTKFSAASKYFKACNLNNVPESDFNVPFSVRAFWVTLDGSKVYGETFIKSIDDYFLAEDVYVSTSSADVLDADGYGTENKPYATINYAFSKVKNQGTVHVVGTYGNEASELTWVWDDHDKTANITGGTIDFTTLPTVALNTAGTNTASVLDVRDSVTFTGITLTFADEQQVYANGNTLEIAPDITWSNTDAYIRVYGGAHTEALKIGRAHV